METLHSRIIAERRKLVSSIQSSDISQEEEEVSFEQGNESFSNVESSSSSVDNSVDQIGSIVSSSYEHSTEERGFEAVPSALNGGLDEIEKDHGYALPFNKSPSELESSKHVSKDSSNTEWSDGLPSFLTNPESSMLKYEELIDLKEPSVEEVNDGATGFTSKDVKPLLLDGPNVMNIILIVGKCAPWSKTGNVS
ncbi:granule-bound starch synthase 2 [Pyrus ussuriensis x Pyrus communis]|uniref:Granule-bound starch synthase 2 n=1 Tax=Pyrus ussuriensis x Pyrus communis TaxID=2448454 RepID=A0A5N5HM41_9ROSA|nr:granule-bound starch synthase 2 [Pyrus ussuriensis x Pyrus communis]